jgi:putative FmdB family regulatory protein
MPIYEYRCAACGHYLDVLQKISDAPLKKCPDCGKSKLTRLVSAASFRLKGGGWYETDFKNNGEKKRNLVESGDGGSSGSESSTAKSDDAGTSAAKDTKPAVKADSSPAKKPKAAAKPASRPAKKTAAKGSRSARS